MDDTLSEAAIFKLTGYKRPADQLRELHRQGFWRARRARTTGEVILERPHYDAVSRSSGQQVGPDPRAIRPKLRPVT